MARSADELRSRRLTVHRLKLVWILAGVTPLQAVFQRWNGARTLVLTLLYVAGWVALRIGSRRDPDGERLRGFLDTRTFGALAIMAAVALQLLLTRYPGHWIAFAVLAACAWFLWVWALTTTSQSLAANLARHTLLAATCVILLVSIEGGLRILDRMKPRNDGITMTWGKPIHSNRFSFREREFAVPKPRGVFRVMVLGDSLTWGAGLSENERYTALTEKYLATLVAGRRIEVLNFGVIGGPTTEEREVLRRHVHDVDPDLIVVGFCVNDTQPRRQDYAVEIESYRPLFRGIETISRVGLTRTAAVLDEKIARLLVLTGRVPDWPEALDRTYARDSREWQAFTEALTDIRRVSDTRQLPSPIFIPLLYGNGDYAKPDRLLSMMLKWTRQAAQAANAAGFRVVSLEDDFKQQGNRIRWVNPWDGHPSRECQVTYARRLAAAIAPVVRASQRAQNSV